jgi:hypothetical protein
MGVTRGGPVRGMTLLVAVMMSSCGRDTTTILPVGASTPTPTAAPTATPHKKPDLPGVVACTIGPGSEITTCGRSHASFDSAIEAAINSVISSNPEIFNVAKESKLGSAAYQVLDKDAYLAGVLDALRAAGYCADVDYANLEWIHIKNSNDSSEQYQVYELDLSGKIGFIVRGAYRSTCNPADFPVPADPGGPPPGTGCGRPFPPPIDRFGSKIHTMDSRYSTLDSTPQIVDAAYCRLIGYTDGRSFCPVRIEGSPDRVACENWRVGTAKDTGRPGPTWTRDGGILCTGPESGCENHPDNQYGLIVYDNGAGLYHMCSETGVCGSVIVDR